MSSDYRFEIAFPADLEQEDQHFASGLNSPGEIRGLSGMHLGITADEIRSGLLEEIELIAGGLTRLFVDSGAFSEVEFNPSSGCLEIAHPITDAMWTERFDLYTWAALNFGPKAYVVAPDCVGDQDLTLARLERWAPHVAAVASLRANIIVPVQKGTLPMSAMFSRACEILGLREMPIAGIPMKKDATSLEDLAELVDSMPWYGARFHLLGLGPKAKKNMFQRAIRCIRSRRPNAIITSDSAIVRGLAGRAHEYKGKMTKTRDYTRFQDDARARGLKGPAVKAYGLGKVSHLERDLEIERANAAGWFDTELFDTLEEAIAHHAALKAER